MEIEEYKHLFTPVTEGLPENNKEVLVITPYAYPFDFAYYNRGFRMWERRAQHGDGYEIIEVSAWLDLSKIKRKDDISCHCTNEEKHGDTKIKYLTPYN